MLYRISISIFLSDLARLIENNYQKPNKKTVSAIRLESVLSTSSKTNKTNATPTRAEISDQKKMEVFFEESDPCYIESSLPNFSCLT